MGAQEKRTSMTKLVPTVNESTALAKQIHRSALLPAALRGKEADVLVTILAGRELGMAPMVALRSIHVVQGKPVLSADSLVGVAQASGQCSYFRCVESTDQIATYETQRRGDQPVQRSFTIADARRANLVNKDNWKKYPAAMLRARCKADLARDVYPDAVAGVYTPDEGEDFGAPAAEADVDNVIDIVPQPEPPSMSFDDVSAALKDCESMDDLRALKDEVHRFEGEELAGLLETAKFQQDLIMSALGMIDPKDDVPDFHTKGTRTEVTIEDKTYKLKPYHGPREPMRGSRVCECDNVYEVLNDHCVCERRIWCAEHGTQCMGSHD